MKLNEWRLFKESLAGGVLGLSQPSVVGGLIGAQFNEDGDEKDDAFDADADDDDDDHDEDDHDFGGDDDDHDEDDHDFGGEDDDEDEEHAADDKGGEGEDDGEGGLKGDLFGSSKDSGTEKSFPPDDSEDMDDLPAPDEEMGDGKDAKQGGGDDMSFLKDIDPQLLGDKDGGDAAAVGLGGDDAGPDAGAEGEPCPDCNTDGSHELGDPDCDTCDGVGFLDDEHGHLGHHDHHDGDDVQDLGGLGDDDLGGELGGDDLGGMADDGSDIDPQHHKDTVDLMKKMAHYMGKYMQKESVTPTVPAAKSSTVKSSGGPKMMKKFMHKDDERKHCPCENNDFMSSLADQAQGTYNKKYASGLYEEPQAGGVGFAPAGRVGSIGGGYTMDDMKDIPVLGESTSYPTLTEWEKFKRRKK